MLRGLWKHMTKSLQVKLAAISKQPSKAKGWRRT
jgi:hypothetical protein